MKQSKGGLETLDLLSFQKKKKEQALICLTIFAKTRFSDDNDGRRRMTGARDMPIALLTESIKAGYVHRC